MADPKNFSKTASSNTTVDGINIAEGAATADMNNALRALATAVAAPADFGDAADAIQTDNISESTAAAGVTIDGLLIKDGDIPAVPTTIAAAITGALPVGTVLPTAVAVAPAGYLFCDGSAVSRATYADLFTAIGEVYGNGDGSTTFNLPDLRGRSPIGVGTGDYVGATARALADEGGLETHTLVESELPVIDPEARIPNIGYSPNIASTVNRGTGTATTSNTQNIAGTMVPFGGDQPHNNMAPYVALNFMIKT